MHSGMSFGKAGFTDARQRDQRNVVLAMRSHWECLGRLAGRREARWKWEREWFGAKSRLAGTAGTQHAVALSGAALGDAKADEAFPCTCDNVVPRYTPEFQAIEVGLQRFGG